MNGTRLDNLLVATAIILTISALSWRGYTIWQMDRQAAHVLDNLEQVADAIHRYHTKTGRWFPMVETGQTQIYPDPFNHPDSNDRYQGLDETRLWLEHNYGMVLQLVRFDSESENRVTAHLFDKSFEHGEPYIRILLDYGKAGKPETRILMHLQKILPKGALAELDDHYYIVDIRQLAHGD